MARNYKAEAKWQSQKYRQMKALIDIDLATRFKLYLANEEISFAEWLRQHIRELNLDEKGHRQK